MSVYSCYEHVHHSTTRVVMRAARPDRLEPAREAIVVVRASPRADRSPPQRRWPGGPLGGRYNFGAVHAYLMGSSTPGGQGGRPRWPWDHSNHQVDVLGAATPRSPLPVGY